MKTKHTQGPWRIEYRPEWIDILNDNNERITSIDNSDDAAEYDAILIASAPNLLKELIHLVRLLEPLEKDGSLDVPGLATLNGARAAIKKATK